MVERLLPKQNAVGSNPITRFFETLYLQGFQKLDSSLLALLVELFAFLIKIF